MAVPVTTYFKQAGVDNALIQLQSQTGLLFSKYSTSSNTSTIIDAIGRLEEIERQAYQLFEVSNLEQLQLKLQFIRSMNETLTKLSGPALWAIIKPALEAKQNNTGWFQEFKEYLEEDLKNDPDIVFDPNGQQGILLTDQILNYIQGDNLKKTIAFKVEKISEISVNNITRRGKQLIKEYIARKKTNNQNSTLPILNSNSMNITAKDWHTITMGFNTTTFEEAAKQNNLTDDQKQYYLHWICELLIKYLREQIPDPKFETICREIFTKKASTYLIGDNITNGITNILGEIQGVYLIRSLINPTYANMLDPNDLGVTWIGGQTGPGSKMPHEDILVMSPILDRTLGIQIKNTTRDVFKDNWEKEITFASRTADTFFEYTDIDPEDQEVLAQIYQLQTFNIEYNSPKDTGLDEYVPGPNEQFAQTRTNIETLKYMADRVMALFADRLMYLASDAFVQQMEQGGNGGSPGNSFILIGGKRLYAASVLLRELLTTIQTSGASKFSVHAEYKSGDADTGTIVEYMNKYKGLLRKDRSEALGSLYLTSSYIFD